jgi:DNA polymerase III subunit alpha
MSAEIPRALLNDKPEEAVRRDELVLRCLRPDRFFVELQQHNIKEITDLNRKLVEMGARYSAKYIATNDVHYINQTMPACRTSCSPSRPSPCSPKPTACA